MKDIKAAILNKLVSRDHIKLARDRAGRLEQTWPVFRNLIDFCNLFLAVPDINEDERIDLVTECLTYRVKLEVPKRYLESFKVCDRMVLTVDHAILRVGLSDTERKSKRRDIGRVTMEIGNVEQKSELENNTLREQRVIELKA